MPRQRRLLTAGSILLLLLLAGPQVLAPDGLELLAMTRGWLGGPVLDDAQQWAPLWPALLLPLSWMDLEKAAWLLNLVMAGAVAWPIHVLLERLGGGRAAAAGVVAWLGLRAMHLHAPVLDARPLLWLLVSCTAALALQGRWRWAFAAAALAPLARPEGAVALPLLAVGALLARQRPLRIGLLALLAATPALLVGLLRGGRSTWEAFYAPWAGVWTVEDYMALNGAASGGTAYRHFVEQAVKVGLESPPSDPLALVEALPRGLGIVGLGLVHSLGALLLLLGLLGLVRLGRLGWRSGVAGALAGLPLLALAPLPMLAGQGSLATNLLFLAPVLVVGAVYGAWGLVGGRGRRWPLAAALLALALVEVHVAPWRCPEPVYMENSRSADALRAWLVAHPPADGAVACTITGRGSVLRAGLQPTPLPSLWEPWSPSPGALALITTVDVLGQDGGRGLEMLESEQWELVQLVGDEDLASWQGGEPRDPDTWQALLRFTGPR